MQRRTIAPLLSSNTFLMETEILLAAATTIGNGVGAASLRPGPLNESNSRAISDTHSRKAY